MKTAATLLLGLLFFAETGAAQQAVAPVAPIADPDALLTPGARQQMEKGLLSFHVKTGRWMAVVIGADLPRIEPEDARPGVGLVLGIGRDTTEFRLLLTDPAWLAGAPAGWGDAVAGLLGKRFRYKPFPDRAVQIVTLLARVMPEKLIFMTRPAVRLSADSVTFSKWIMILFGVCVVVGYVHISWRAMSGDMEK